MSEPETPPPSSPTPSARPPSAPPTAAEQRTHRRRIATARRVALVAVLVLGALVDGFFALVNFYPVAPRRDRGPARYVIAEMTQDEADWFQQNMLDEYNDAYDTNLHIRAVDDESLEASLAAPDVALAVMPLPAARDIASRGGAAPFEGTVSRARIERDFAGLRPDVMTPARYRDVQYFLPRQVVLDVALYRVSRVRDAMLHWHLVQPEIEAALRAVNGRGLPAGYSLEQEPPAWDSYDLFVMAFYWAHRSYAGQPAHGRVAHRAGSGEDGQQDIVAGIYRAGATDATIASRDSVASRDWFQWELLDRAQGAFVPAMYAADGLDDEGVEQAIAAGDVFFASVDQVEAWGIHGGGHRGSRPRVPDEDDLGFVALPHFASLELDASGHPARTAPSFSFREESVWVLPAHHAGARDAYRLAAWVMNDENHPRECEALGSLPIRTDTVRDRVTRFRSPWMLDIFQAGLLQWNRAQPVPGVIGQGLGLDYALTWDRVMRTAPVAPNDNAGLLAALRAPVDRNAVAQEAPEAADDAGAPRDDAAVRAVRSFAVAPLREPIVLQWPNADGGAPDVEVRQ